MGEHTEVTRRELQQLLNVPSYPPALMLMHSTFSFLPKANLSSDLTPSHLLKDIVPEIPTPIIHQLFSPLYWIISVVYKYVLISPTSKFKIKTLSPPATPIIIIFFFFFRKFGSHFLQFPTSHSLLDPFQPGIPQPVHQNCSS